jgi:pyridoxal phosphate enzyme (YggS family)
VQGIEDNLKRVEETIRQAALSCGRDPASIKLLAVSKTFPAEIVEQTFRAGQRLFGENRVQEAAAKIPSVQADGICWHMVGHLQTNKIRQAVQLFDVIESIDSEKVALGIDQSCRQFDKIMPVLIQINVGEEPQKFGIRPGQVHEVVEKVDALPNLDLQGLMAIPPYATDPEASRPYFRRMSELLYQVNAIRTSPLRELSMGMSSDFPVAIEEGATVVRVGTSIFGARTRKPAPK